MDYVTRQFIVLAKKLRDDFRQMRETLVTELRQLRKAIEQNGKAHHDQQERTNQQHPPLELSQPIKVTAEVSLTNVPVGDTPAEKERNYKVQNSIKHAAWFAGIAAALYGGIAIAQWFAMRDSNKISRESLESVQRAFVTSKGTQLETFQISLDPKVSETWVFSGLVENSGTTPAIDEIEYFNGGELNEEPSGKQFIGDGKDFPIGELGPKDTRRVGQMIKQNDFILGTFPLTADALNSGQFHVFFQSHKVFFWGWVAYRDVFSETQPHVTEFCSQVTGIKVMIDPTTKRVSPALQMSGCRQHNCTDEHCPEYKAIAAMVPK